MIRPQRLAPAPNRWLEIQMVSFAHQKIAFRARPALAGETR